MCSAINTLVSYIRLEGGERNFQPRSPQPERLQTSLKVMKNRKMITKMIMSIRTNDAVRNSKLNLNTIELNKNFEPKEVTLVFFMTLMQCRNIATMIDLLFNKQKSIKISSNGQFNSSYL